MYNNECLNATIHEGVVEGHCVAIRDNYIIYAGPIKTSPGVAGILLLLHTADFAKLKYMVNRQKH